MPNKRTTTIFKQLILNVIFPALIALLILAGINYIQKKSILTDAIEEKHAIISEELVRMMEMLDAAFEILSENISQRMEALSGDLVNDIFRNTQNIETADLEAIRESLDMDPDMEDIYVVSREGIVVNSTFKEDIGLNLFAFGEEHRTMLLDVFLYGKFYDERFGIEAETKRMKKFSYQPTIDGNYIIELGFYSREAEDFLDFIQEKKSDITRSNKNIVDVELFVMADETIFSFNKNAETKEEHRGLREELFEKRGSRILNEHVGNTWLQYQYTYLHREGTDLYKGAVIRVVSDRSDERKLLKREFFKFLIVLGSTLAVVTALVYRKTRIITDPIKRLVNSVDRISDGRLSERAEVLGNNEITTLSTQFNNMIEQLEVLYNDLEDKVRERTAEVVKQKEEIEAQRDSIQEQRNKLMGKNKQLNEAYHEIEEQQRNITDSIRYAKRIQAAIMPRHHYVREILENVFILYLPKDIVSGDFYWFKKTDDLVMLAAVDCTGHGVPGAFVSIVGHSGLNYAVNVAKARKAADILNELNQGVIETLKEKDDASIKDGMDLALCTIDYKNMMLNYAGAFNPLCMIRDGEIILYKGNKFPIGAFYGTEIPKFTNHEIRIRKGDLLYLYSDGYADQFGGPGNKKFMTGKFRDLLLQIHKEPVDKQKVLLEERFHEWKGGNEQVDDVLVIGVKI